MLTPLMLPLIPEAWGWQAAFLVIASFGALWLVLWLVRYHNPDEHPTVSRAELAHVTRDIEPARSAFPTRASCACAAPGLRAGYAITAPVFWFYLYWLPPFLNQQYHLGISVTQMGIPLIVIYLCADIGSVGGGALSSRLIAAACRRCAHACCRCWPSPCASLPSSWPRLRLLWMAVAAISVAIGAHRARTANIWSPVMDYTPKHVISSVFGFGGMIGAIGGMFMTQLVGYVLTATHDNYTVLFTMIPCAYFIALARLFILAPRKVAGAPPDAPHHRPTDHITRLRDTKHEEDDDGAARAGRGQRARGRPDCRRRDPLRPDRHGCPLQHPRGRRRQQPHPARRRRADRQPLGPARQRPPGGGTKALFILESGFFPDTGGSAGRPPVRPHRGGRPEGGYGKLALGRQYTLAHEVLSSTRPWPSPTTPSSATVGGNYTGLRYDNTIKYIKSFGGLQAAAAYTFGEVPGSLKTGSAAAGSLVYGSGPSRWARSTSRRRTSPAPTSARCRPRWPASRPCGAWAAHGRPRAQYYRLHQQPARRGRLPQPGRLRRRARYT